MSGHCEYCGELVCVCDIEDLGSRELNAIENMFAKLGAKEERSRTLAKLDSPEMVEAIGERLVYWLDALHEKGNIYLSKYAYIDATPLARRILAVVREELEK